MKYKIIPMVIAVILFVSAIVFLSTEKKETPTEMARRVNAEALAAIMMTDNIMVYKKDGKATVYLPKPSFIQLDLNTGEFVYTPNGTQHYPISQKGVLIDAFDASVERSYDEVQELADSGINDALEKFKIRPLKPQ